ncbi:hypothetical protein LDENG_00212760 [Lucifuga dentata]|nr:hypothetical protein LDENG_00212760 [Lucifuga dentata]
MSTYVGNGSVFPCRVPLQRRSLSLALSTVQLATVWLVSKAFQFLSSWSLKKFLLITHGDLTVLRVTLERIVQQTKSLMMTTNDGLHHCTHHHHHSVCLLRQQVAAVDGAFCELQAFSALVLKMFSRTCKKVSADVCEHTMPSAKHWRLNRAAFPSIASEYASLAARTVIGQVLEGVAPLSDDARVQALSLTVTAFMEAWMEHILKQKIKFSIHGALQLKQDFDSVRDLIQSDRSGLSAEQLQQLLSLRVFQQVDSAIVCLLQQPQAKPYFPSRGWEPFRRCCPARRSRESADAADVSCITNLENMEGEILSHSDPAVLTSDIPPLETSPPGDPYLAPSVDLGAAQKEWLDLRIHSSAPWWRLPGLQCLSKSDP